MNSTAKINLLVLPPLFPSSADDLKGIFVLDYLKCVQAHCSTTVLHFTPSGNSSNEEEFFSGFSVYRYSFSKFRTRGFLKWIRYPFYLHWMKKIILKHAGDADIIHTHGSFLQGYAALLAVRKSGKPLVITEHTGPFSKLTKSRIIKYVVKKAIENADILLTVSNDLKKQILKSGITPKKSIVTYNPVDTDLYRPKEGEVKSSHRNIVFAGRLEDYKGALRTLKAFRILNAQNPEWHLTIIGDGPERNEIIQFLNHNPRLYNHVRLTGQITRQRMAEEFQRASFFVFPSLHETFGLVIAEAMSAGLPVITGNETAPVEYVDRECGILVPAKDIRAIVTAMEQMIGTVDKYNSEAIRKKIVTQFGLEIFGRKLVDIYQSLL